MSAGGCSDVAFLRAELLSVDSGQEHLALPSHSHPTTTVELTVRCSQIYKMDVTSKSGDSGPMCVLFQRGSERDPWVETGRTEILEECRDQAWSRKFRLDYSFEEKQFVKFEIYDSDSASSDLKEHALLGRKETTLAAVVSSRSKQYVAVLKDTPVEDAGSKLLVNVEEASASDDLVQVQLSANNLDKDNLGKSDLYFVLSKTTASGEFSVVHRSQVVKNNSTPTWKSVDLPVRELCDGTFSRPLKIDVYNWDGDGDHDLIGSFRTTLNELMSSTAEKNFALVNPQKQEKEDYVDSGSVSVKYIQVIQRHSFVDYLQGGTTINFSVAIDFTASNGDPTDNRSLHYRRPPHGENEYTQAIRAIGDIISDYHADQKYPAFGFGAKMPPDFSKVSHDFCLNLEAPDPFCSGVEGVLRAYDFSQRSVQQYGPTYFTPVIKHVAKFANTYKDGRRYLVLLILTDGIITDLEETMRAIVEVSALPISIIILGIGAENFAAMDVLLDSGRGLVRASGSGEVAARDIVQFVEMRKFLDRDGICNKELLAKHVLAQIPKQFVGWMTIRGIEPLCS